MDLFVSLRQENGGTICSKLDLVNGSPALMHDYQAKLICTILLY